MTFAFYDAINNQKLTANFNWMPDLDAYLSLIIPSKTKPTSCSSNGTTYSQSNGAKNSMSSNETSNIFSLNGVDFGPEPLQMLNTDLKQVFYARIKKVND